MSAPECISDVDRLRARDGDNCWLCGKAIDFEAEPNSSKAWSREHLLAQSHDGPSRMENLVLCHPPCNKILANRSLPDKIGLRERRLRKEWVAVVRARLAKVL